MPLFSKLAAVILLLMAHCGSWTGANRLGSFKVCPSCRDPLGAGRPPRDHNAVRSLPAAAQGERCGVRVANCAEGLRCNPEPGESALIAITLGEGVCTSYTGPYPTERPSQTNPQPPQRRRKGPCRKKLETEMRNYGDRLILPGSDIYVPNCDDRGFYKKKQCRSSTGKKRQCWCVDRKGENVDGRTDELGEVHCD